MCPFMGARKANKVTCRYIFFLFTILEKEIQLREVDCMDIFECLSV